MVSFLKLSGASTVQYVIPAYQRTRAREGPVCGTLRDVVIRAVRQNGNHFIGSVLRIPKTSSTITGVKRSLTIEGQRRMMTIPLFLETFVKHSEENTKRAEFLTGNKVPERRKSCLLSDAVSAIAA